MPVHPGHSLVWRRAGRLTLTVALLAGCGASGTAPASGAAPSTEPGGAAAATTAPSTTAAPVELIVMSSGPFKRALEGAAQEYSASQPGVTIKLNLAHMPALLSQLREGAPGDVLVTPDADTMNNAGSAGLTDTATVIGKNQLALVVPAGNPGGVKGVADLGREDLRIAVCAPTLPCGKVVAQLAERNGVTPKPDTEEAGGSPGVVTKAAAGEIDLGVVFAADVPAGGDRVTRVDIPEDKNVATDISAAVVRASKHRTQAAGFVDYLNSPQGRAKLTGAGFAGR